MHQSITYEQAVYGSFAFREGGYGLLASSPGCRPEWLSTFASACQKFGEPPGATPFSRAIFSLRLDVKDGPWMIVGVSPTGHDDRGRPGALAFHGLFVEEREFRGLGFDPFRLAGELRSDWTEATTCLSNNRVAGVSTPPPVSERSKDRGRGTDPGHPTKSVVDRLLLGRRVAIESPSPIDDLARDVWAELPEKFRKKTSVATWAFGNGNHFDLIAVPRLEAIEWDASYAEPNEKTAPTRRPVPWRKIAYASIIALIGIGLMAPILKTTNRNRPAPPIASHPEASIAAPIGPDPASYRDQTSDPAALGAVSRGLAEFADRFGIPLDGNPPDPSSAMIRLADRLRYRGPLLTPSEQAQLAKENVPGRSRAIAWDAHIRHFVADRPLPGSFAQGSLRWKLDTFAWSFHIDPNPRIAAEEIPRAMADALTLDEPIGANPLAAKYPTLAEYARFLARLPGR